MTAPDAHVDDLIGPYALDAVDAAEREVVDAHLRECDRCRAELRELSEGVVRLSDGFETEPPAELRASVLRAVARESQHPEPADEPQAAPRHREQATTARGRGVKALWGLAAAGLLAVGGWGVWESVDDELSPVEAVIEADDAERFRTDYEGTPVTVVASPSLDRAVLLTDDLPEVAADEVYQGWWIDDEGTITSAGVLDEVAGSSGAETALKGDPAVVNTFALSVEPEGGSEQPSTDPVVLVPLQN